MHLAQRVLRTGRPSTRTVTRCKLGRKVRRVWLATPDDGLGRAEALPFEEGNDAGGYYITFTVPELLFWSLILVDQRPDIVVDGSPNDWRGTPPELIHAVTVDQGEWLYRGEANDHRTFGGATVDSDITEVRITADNTYVYFLVRMQEISNAVNNSVKEIVQRYDFKGSNTEIELDQKEKQILVRTEDEMKMEAVREIVITHAVRRKVDTACLDFGKVEPAGGKTLRRVVTIKEGIEREIASKIVKDIKDSKIKAQASIQGDELRISGKKRDDLQSVIALLKSKSYGIPLQFVNMRD